MGIISIFNNAKYMLLVSDPLEIIGNPPQPGGNTRILLRETGISAFGQILDAFGILSAAIIIIASLGTLVIVNYPKTVAQTKEKVANAFMTVCFIAAFPFLADVIYTVMYNIFF